MKKSTLTTLLLAAAASSAFAEGPDFVKDIAPVLEASCVKCHSGEKPKGKLDMSTKEAFLKGGKNGKLIEVGKPDDSALIKSILLPEDDDDTMPPKDKAPRPTKEQIDLLKKWVESGAAWPDGVVLKGKK